MNRPGDEFNWIVLMGPAGSGKTTVGVALAQHLGWKFYEGDDFHPSANIAKMTSGIPLTDSDRVPWLDRLHELITTAQSAAEHGVLACSALKLAGREALRTNVARVDFVYLEVGASILERRLEQRPGHYMGAEMLDSQLQALEVPGSDEALHVDAALPVGELVESICGGLGPGS